MQAGRIMLKRLHELAAERADFAFESTLASRSYARWINRIRRDGYSLHLLFLWLRSPEIAIERVKERVRMGGHDVPEEVIRRRYHRGVRNFFDIYQPLAETWMVYDNSTAVEPLLIADGEGKQVRQMLEPELWASYCKVEQ
jgi:predicted ABC-type ATPase